ncbi:MFS transporter [Flexibacterium corallicola]|uniref:MFS transporter n=1 Tax=Flexibacterium corallicola TaxID=3037259 RepID=UPI00286ECBED|nr:MFS transporter [Pseudovibrio sp. M1P-2-3]
MKNGKFNGATTASSPLSVPLAAGVIPQDSSLFSGPQLIATLLLSLGVGSHAVNGLISNAVLPSLIRDLGGQERAFWVFSLFQIASILSSTTAGILKSHWGAKYLFIAGAILLALGSIFAGTADNLGQVLLGRTLQGLGEGFIVAMCYAVIPDLFPKELVAKVFALLAGIWAIAAAVAPVSAGLLTQFWSWRAAYIFNLPLTGLLLLMAVFVMPNTKVIGELNGKRKGLIMLPRLFMLAFAVLLITSVGEARSTTQGFILLALGLFTLAATRIWDRNSENSFIPKEAFSFNTPVGLAMWVILIASLSGSARVLFANSIIQSTWGLNVLSASYLVATLAFSWSFMAWLTSKVQSPKHQYSLIVLGKTLNTLGIGMLAAALWMNSLAILTAGLIISGLGYGMSNHFLSKQMMFASSEKERDKASGFIPTMMSSGIAIGGALSSLLALATGMLSNETSELITKEAALEQGPTLFLIMAGIAVISVLFAGKLAVLGRRSA